MRLFEKRPLCFACSAALLLCLLFAHAGIYAVIITAAVCAAGLCAALIFKSRHRRTLVILFIAVLLSCSTFSVYFIFSRTAECEGAKIQGYVLPYSENDYTQIYKITQINGKPANIKAVSVGTKNASGYAEFEATADLSPYGGVNASLYRSRGILYSAEISEFQTTGKIHRGVTYYADSLRAFLAGRFYMISDNAGILCRIFLGVADGAPDDFVSDMRTLGLSHLLAVSGLHVTALLAGLDFLLSRIFGKNKANYVVLAVFALLYMVVTGLSGSVIRASLMYLISRVSLLSGRKNDGATSLMFAALVIVLINPASSYDVGFLLSVTATLGIVTAGVPLSSYLSGRLPAKLGFLKPVISAVLITASALLFTLPVAASSYGKLAYGAVLYNLIAAPLVTVLLYACPYALLFSFIPFAGRVIGLFCDGICSVLVSTVRFFAQNSPPSVSVLYPFVIPLICVFAAALFVCAVLTKKKRVYICLAISFILVFSLFASVFSLTYNKKAVIIVSPGKYGDYVAVTEGGNCTVFDCTSGAVDGFYPLSQKLLSLGVTHADYVIVSDPSARHVQSLVRACSYFDIDGIYTPSEVKELSELLCKRSVTANDEISQTYGKATVTALTGMRFISVSDGVYCFGEDDADTGYVKRFKIAVYGSGMAEGELTEAAVTHYIKKSEGIKVIYVDI
jgi:competence protein ComEC